MTPRFFEAIYKGKRFIGMDAPDGSAQLTLYQITLKKLLNAFKGELNPDNAREYLQSMTQSVILSQDSLEQLTLLPPLLPDSTGDALVSGFMQTHNIKIDQASLQLDKPVLPNWFIKGLSSSLKVSGRDLTTPDNPIAICEEAEVVLIYLDDESGRSQYCGYTFGNDLTDIGRFKNNPGHLAYAKLCDAAISYWLYVGLPPEKVHGEVIIERNGKVAWQGAFNTGLTALGYRLEDMIDHLFSFPTLRHSERVHYVYLGADRSSYHQGFRIESGDRVVMNFSSHDLVIENAIRFGV